MYDKDSELYNEFLEIYYHKYYGLSNDKRKIIESKYDPKDLFLDGYDYSMWSENKEESIVKEELTDLSDMARLEDHKEEVKEGKGLKTFNSKQTINQTSNIISTNKIWQQFIKIKE